MIREYIQKKLRGYYVSGVEIERNQKTMRVIIRTSRPGMIIGRNGEGVTTLKANILKLLSKGKVAIPSDFKLDIAEVANPDADATIVAYSVAEGLEKRLPFRRVLKQMVEKVIADRSVKEFVSSLGVVSVVQK